MAGCTLALACGAGFIQAAYLGNVMAAIEANDLGNIPIDLERLRRWLTAQPELIHLPDRQPICWSDYSSRGCQPRRGLMKIAQQFTAGMQECY